MDYILVHSGIKGQKWGIRRYQYLDGTLTPEGRYRYLKGHQGFFKKNRINAAQREVFRINSMQSGKDKNKRISEFKKKYGFSYDNAKWLGAKEANRIQAYANKKDISFNKANNKLLVKDVLIGLSKGAAGLYLAYNPQVLGTMLSYGKYYVNKIADSKIMYNAKNLINEGKIFFDKNIVTVKPNIVSEILKLPLNTLGG